MSESNNAIERLMRRVAMLIWRGRISTVNDAGGAQVVQVALNPKESPNDVVRIAEYGLASNPPIGSDAVMLCLGGNRTNGVVIATNHQGSRMKGLAPGEVAIYDNLGQSIHLTASGIIVKSDLGVKYVTPKLEVTGEVIDCTATGNTTPMSKFREIYNDHDHGDVMPGDARTSKPEVSA